MRVVIDTNILLVSISQKSAYRWVFDNFLEEKYTLCVTTEILMEYEEILSRHMGEQVASVILQIIENAPNVELITRYFKWNLITVDPDDNKFVDCAIAAGAKYLVTHDKHFDILSNVDFPKVDVIAAEEFKEILDN
ncbi:MAG: putative toxin-antitoxin system toxin component, PIN family [Chitinophagales bacterium]